MPAAYKKIKGLWGGLVAIFEYVCKTPGIQTQRGEIDPAEKEFQGLVLWNAIFQAEILGMVRVFRSG